MDDALHIPKDFARRREFRLLEREVGKVRAAAWVMFLFRDLAYAAQHSPLGMLSASDAGLLSDALGELGGRRTEDGRRRTERRISNWKLEI